MRPLLLGTVCFAIRHGNEAVPSALRTWALSRFGWSLGFSTVALFSPSPQRQIVGNGLFILSALAMQQRLAGFSPRQLRPASVGQHHRHHWRAAVSHSAQALHIAERLRESIASAPLDLGNGNSAVVTISIGLATTRDAQANIEALYRDADAALYRAKEEGRNRVVMFLAA